MALVNYGSICCKSLKLAQTHIENSGMHEAKITRYLQFRGEFVFFNVLRQYGIFRDFQISPVGRSGLLFFNICNQLIKADLRTNLKQYLLKVGVIFICC